MIRFFKGSCFILIIAFIMTCIFPLSNIVALAQLRKIDKILALLKKNKLKLKSLISGIPGMCFRKIYDENGECATLLTLLFESKEKADQFCAGIGSKTISYSGWHVYNNMEQILEKKTSTEFNCPYACAEYGREVRYWKHMLPKTDGILERAINVSKEFLTIMAWPQNL